MALDQPPSRLIRAPADWRQVDFISDLHLQEQVPQTFELWQTYMAATPADAVFILGDLFEVWVGDDAALTAHEHGFERRCMEVLRTASAIRPVHFMRGNRDFLVGSQFLQASGVFDLDDPTVLIWGGQRYLLAHGDALCLGDTDYQTFRMQVRSASWQQGFLARSLSERRTIARQLREQSEVRKLTRETWVDVDDEAVQATLLDADSQLLIHGHTHRPGRHELGTRFGREVLSDWDGTAQPVRAQVLRLSGRGLQRLSPAQALTA